MTNNQIAYANYQELVRHNKQTENLGYGQLSETVRHNMRTEDLGFGQLAETSRHNYVTEDINWYNAEENVRHNLISEDQLDQQIMQKSTQLGIEYANMYGQNVLRFAQADEAKERTKNYSVEREKTSAETKLVNARVDLTNAQQTLALAKTRESNLGLVRGSIDAVKGIASLFGLGGN